MAYLPTSCQQWCITREPDILTRVIRFCICMKWWSLADDILRVYHAETTIQMGQRRRSSASVICINGDVVSTGRMLLPSLVPNNELLHVYSTWQVLHQTALSRIEQRWLHQSPLTCLWLPRHWLANKDPFTQLSYTWTFDPVTENQAIYVQVAVKSLI